MGGGGHTRFEGAVDGPSFISLFLSCLSVCPFMHKILTAQTLGCGLAAAPEPNNTFPHTIFDKEGSYPV